MKINKFLLIGSLFFIFSCNENRVYEKHIDPSGNIEWNRNEVVEFDVKIDDASLEYNEIVALRYSQTFMYTAVPVQITRTGPDGAEEITKHEFHVRDEDGTRQGEPAGDIWDLEEILHEKIKFPVAGNYHYKIEHLHQKDKLHFVMEVGIIIDKIPTQP